MPNKFRKRFCCEFKGCKQHFYSEANYTIHQATHEELESEWKCSECDQDFPSSSCLVDHKFIAHFQRRKVNSGIIIFNQAAKKL